MRQAGIVHFKRIVIAALQGMLMVVVALSLLELGIDLAKRMMQGPYLLLGLPDLLELLGSFLLILIGLELLDTMTAYLRESVVTAEAAEVVLIVAITAVCRKAIVVDYHATQPTMLFGVGTVILCLCIAYYLLCRARGRAPQPEQGCDPDKARPTGNEA